MINSSSFLIYAYIFSFCISKSFNLRSMMSFFCSFKLTSLVRSSSTTWAIGEDLSVFAGEGLLFLCSLEFGLSLRFYASSDALWLPLSPLPEASFPFLSLLVFLPLGAEALAASRLLCKNSGIGGASFNFLRFLDSVPSGNFEGARSPRGTCLANCSRVLFLFDFFPD